MILEVKTIGLSEKEVHIDNIETNNLVRLIFEETDNMVQSTIEDSTTNKTKTKEFQINDNWNSR